MWNLKKKKKVKLIVTESRMTVTTGPGVKEREDTDQRVQIFSYKMYKLLET